MIYDDIFFTFIVSCHFHMLNCARDGHVHVINNACIKCTNAIFYTGPVFPKHFQISYFSRSQRHLAHVPVYMLYYVESFVSLGQYIRCMIAPSVMN